jgi:hypothetical protein
MKIGFWDMKPFNNPLISRLPFELGLLPLLSILMSKVLQIQKYKPLLVIIMFSILTTILEYCGVFIGWIYYDKGWNIRWTFISYLLPYSLLSVIYKWMDNRNFFDNYNHNQQ